jgi:hypothetical protein
LWTEDQSEAGTQIPVNQSHLVTGITDRQVLTVARVQSHLNDLTLSARYT